MTKRKYHYYVQVTQCYGDENGEIESIVKRCVTKLDQKTKMAKWEKNKKPLEMSKDMANAICEGLLLNFYEAVVIQSYLELEKTYNFDKE